MGFFSKRQTQPALPDDIVNIMERFGRFEFDPQGSSEDEARDIGALETKLFQFASADPEGFLVALAGAVLPVGGWAVYGAERLILSLLGPSFSQHPSYNAIMSASVEFLRTNGVPPMKITGYEWEYWVTHGGTSDTWIPRPSTPSQVVSNTENVPDSAEAWMEVGIADIQKACYAEALAAFDYALQLDPNRIVSLKR